MTRKLFMGLAGLAVLGALGYGVYAWVFSRSHIWTDDAYVEGTIAQVSAKVGGHVAELLVDDNQAVKAARCCSAWIRATTRPGATRRRPPPR